MAQRVGFYKTVHIKGKIQAGTAFLASENRLPPDYLRR